MRLKETKRKMESREAYLKSSMVKNWTWKKRRRRKSRSNRVRMGIVEGGRGYRREYRRVNGGAGAELGD